MASITSVHYPIAEHLTSGSSSILPPLTCNRAPDTQSFPSSWGPSKLLSYYRSSFKTLSIFSSHPSPCSLAKPITSGFDMSVTFCTSSHSFQSRSGVVPLYSLSGLQERFAQHFDLWSHRSGHNWYKLCVVCLSHTFWPVLTVSEVFFVRKVEICGLSFEDRCVSVLYVHTKKTIPNRSCGRHVSYLEWQEKKHRR